MKNNEKEIIKALHKIDAQCAKLSINGKPEAAYNIRLILVKLEEECTRDDKQAFYNKLKEGTK
ncbi:MAG: hypothetical protein WC755_08555 [Candidatus Woesearchaeota archaeon]|jgi:hypothetical protein